MVIFEEMEIDPRNRDDLQAMCYPDLSIGEGFDYLEFYTVNQLWYRDPDGNIFLRRHREWRPIDIEFSNEISESIYYVNVNVKFIDVFDFAQSKDVCIYQGDLGPWLAPNPIFDI